MNSIYILLMKSHTVFSRVINATIKGSYTHASIALDRDLTELYSFGRKYKYSMLPAGFVREDITKGVMGSSDTIECAVYELKISDKSYERLLRRIRHMDANCQRYRYNILGIPACFFNIETERKRHFFCSQFVSFMLQNTGAVEIEKAPSLTKPEDFTMLPGAKEIFKGNMGQLRSMRLLA